MKLLRPILLILSLLLILTLNLFSQLQNWTVYKTENSDLPNNIVNAVVVDDNDDKWVASGRDVVKISGDTWTIYRTENLIPNDILGEIAIDLQQNKWIRTINSGLLKLDNNNQFTLINHASGFPGSDSVTAVSIDSNNHVWVGSFDGISELTENGWLHYSGKDYLPHDTVNAIEVDKFNNVWIGTFDGLVKYDRTNWRLIDTSEYQLASKYIISLDINENNNIWIGTKAGMAKFDGLKWSVFNPTINNDKLNNNIWSIDASKDFLWIGFKFDYDRIAAKYDSAGWHFFGPDNSKLPTNDMQSIAVDDSNHVWFGTYLGGLIELFDTGIYDDILIADFKADTTIGYAPLPVHFTDLSVGSPISWKWNFGDGSTSTSQNPYHTYTQTGKYTVTLIVDNGNIMDTLVKVEYITVSEPQAEVKLIKINNPYEGEKIYANSKYPIEWETSDNIARVNIYYKLSFLSQWILLVSNTPTNEGLNYFKWNPVPNTISDDCYMRIVDSDDQAAFDISGPFSIITEAETPGYDVLEVCSDVDWGGKEVKTKWKSDPSKNYRFTFYGNYRLFQRATPCANDGDVSCGFDAVYAYDVPSTAIQVGAWPSKSALPLPHWLGDTTNYDLGGSRSLTLSKHTGFRFNGDPLPDMGYMQNHRYIVTDRPGTGDYFSFSIIDSIKNGNNTEARYDGNRDCISILIEEVMDLDIDFCDYKLFWNEDSTIVLGMQLNAGVFVKDTSLLTGRRNILKDVDPDELGIVENGRFICPIDSIVCDELEVKSEHPLHIGLLVDRSLSMLDKISDSDTNKRIDAAKKALTGFIDNMRNTDSAFVMSFGTTSSLNLDWSNDKNALKQAVNLLAPTGETYLWGSIHNALQKLEPQRVPRALVLLSDGGNTIDPQWDQSKILSEVQNNSELPIYVVALGMSDDSIDTDGRNKLGQLAEASGGKIFDVYSASQLNEVYQKINDEITESECCKIYFHAQMDSCGWIKLIYSPEDTVTISRVFYYCGDISMPVDTTTMVEETSVHSFEMRIAPNPFDKMATLDYNLYEQGNIKICIFDLTGNKIIEIDRGIQSEGEHHYIIDGNKILSGTYLATVTLNNVALTRKIVVIH